MARAVIKFDLTSIPSNAKVVSAQLMVHTGKVIDENTYPAAKHLVGIADGQWDEKELTWFNVPELIRTKSFSNWGWTKKNKEIFSDLLTEVQEMVIGTRENFGFVFAIGNHNPKNYTIQIHSSESAELEKRPTLTIKYIEGGVSVVNSNKLGNNALSVTYNGGGTFSFAGLVASEITAEVFTLAGKKVLEKNVILSGKSAFFLPVTEMASGSYLLSVETGNGIKKTFQFYNR